MPIKPLDSKISDLGNGRDPNASVAFPIKGISYVATDMKINNSHLQPVLNINANWIALMPFAYSPWGKTETQELAFNNTFQWWGETDAGIIETTQLAHENGLKVLLKPQLWLDGKYTGFFTLASEKEWEIWENNYSNYILHFAHLGDSLNVEMFCIGTELKLTVANRPIFWNILIDSIKTFYDGELTYAANWDDYQDIPFWKKLDYIGINGYFPLSNKTSPTVKELCDAWSSTISSIANFQNKINKPVLFTEIGYKSVDQNVSEPWNPVSMTINMQAQKNATEAFLSCYKNIPWFAGCFFWKWYPNHETVGGMEDDDYTPQNKPTSELIRKYFKNK